MQIFPSIRYRDLDPLVHIFYRFSSRASYLSSICFPSFAFLPANFSLCYCIPLVFSQRTQTLLCARWIESIHRAPSEIWAFRDACRRFFCHSLSVSLSEIFTPYNRVWITSVSAKWKSVLTSTKSAFEYLSDIWCSCVKRNDVVSK